MGQMEGESSRVRSLWSLRSTLTGPAAVTYWSEQRTRPFSSD